MATCDRYREWIDLELDGALAAAERRELEAHLAGCADCAAERRRLERLHRRLAESRIPVRAGFRERVLAALPATGWEARPARAWRLPGLLLAALGSATLLLAAVGGLRLEPQGPLPAALAAVVELLATSALAGAQLMGASWRALGLAVNELVLASPTAVAALLLVLACLSALFVRLVRGAGAAPVRQRAAASDDGEGERRRG